MEPYRLGVNEKKQQNFHMDTGSLKLIPLDGLLSLKNVWFRACSFIRIMMQCLKMKSWIKEMWWML
jgi:hypothetical protein